MLKKTHKFWDVIVHRIVSSKYVSRWTILGIDLILSVISLVWCYLFDSSLHFNDAVSLPKVEYLIIGSLFICPWYFLFFKTHTGIIRYSSYHEVGRVLVAVVSINLTYYIVGLLSGYGYSAMFISLIVKNTTLNFIILIAFRFVVVSFYRFLTTYVAGRYRQRSLVYGVSRQSIALASLFLTDGYKGYRIVGFLTHDKHMIHQRIFDLPVYYADDNLDHVIREYKISALFLVKKQPIEIPDKKILRQCIDLHIKILSPDQAQMFRDLIPQKYYLNPQIKDLLGRDEIQIDFEKIKHQVENKTVMVTGAAGSIGCEMVRQLATFKPQKIILFDSAETPLNSLLLEMDKYYPNVCEAILGDIRIRKRLEFVFRKYHPSIIYHAAAYKHVPMVERNPCEAVLTNVLGTRNIANYALKFRVEKFIMVSTDKAVNPSNVMGASKRIAEIYIQSLANHLDGKSATKFITTRFGNVLGSNGSVIPLFKEQIENGGPVTVTHPNIIRYFMTIPEACRLVLEAGVMGHNGNIYIFDMGKPVKISDLAKKMIEMAGLIPNRDIRIVYTGLRPGEKLYEELLNDKEITQPTTNPKIKVAKVRKYKLSVVAKLINELIIKAMLFDTRETVKKMKEIVPEFISMNSAYERFDKKLPD
ncbi:nucleoside-diphosphate sugar epimerase/dehydratase [Paludibacter sp.]|uniref:polysaccharide biosynthesis protein n=1 Tax=Paludibacter sp. TaxID=1898105 RepID=UPI001352CB77|nr:nucleoside-diphosphate sugar epimerase/dehydratase [Paludibacter sp.]MTK53253.1 polysaccharide biosynthesis protein [Paludibacter sp.]